MDGEIVLDKEFEWVQRGKSEGQHGDTKVTVRYEGAQKQIMSMPPRIVFLSSSVFPSGYPRLPSPTTALAV